MQYGGGIREEDINVNAINKLHIFEIVASDCLVFSVRAYKTNPGGSPLINDVNLSHDFNNDRSEAQYSIGI